MPRDTDDSLRVKITAAAPCGGFVLLAGSSSTGNNRNAYEVVEALLRTGGFSTPSALTRSPRWPT